MEILGGILGTFIVIVVAALLIALAVLWFILPFLIYSIKHTLEKCYKEMEKTRKHLDSLTRE